MDSIPSGSGTSKPLKYSAGDRDIFEYCEQLIKSNNKLNSDIEILRHKLQETERGVVNTDVQHRVLIKVLKWKLELQIYKLKNKLKIISTQNAILQKRIHSLEALSADVIKNLSAYQRINDGLNNNYFKIINDLLKTNEGMVKKDEEELDSAYGIGEFLVLNQRRKSI